MCKILEIQIVQIIIDISPLIGLALQTLGAFFMANAYLNQLNFIQSLGVFFSSLRRGCYAKKGEKIKLISQDKVIVSLQGLSFIGIGFFIQFLSDLAKRFCE